MLDLLLVNPSARLTGYSELGELSAIEPPLWCALLASYIRKQGYGVAILDAEAENLSTKTTAERIAEANPSVAGIIVLGQNPSTSSTPKMTAVGEILRELRGRAPHIKTLVGGLHPSALPLKTANEFQTYVCQGEGFITIAELVRALKDGSFPKPIPGLWAPAPDMTVSIPKLVDLNSLPIPAWDLLPMEMYRACNWHCLADIDNRSPYGVIFTSLGCPFDCNFCQIKQLYNGKPGIRYLSPEKVVQQVDILVKDYGVKNIKILDEIFTLDEGHVLAVCDAIIQRGYDLNIWAYGRVDRVNIRILGRMKQAGINWVAYGIESSSARVRKSVNKMFTQIEIEQAIQITHSAGINIMGNFMFGLPYDDMETMQATLDMAKDFNLEWVNFYPTFAYPGSKLYEDVVRIGTKLPDSWDAWGPYSKNCYPMPTKYLSSEEVLEFRDKAFTEYFSRPNYLKMVEDRFGLRAREYVEEMLRVRLARR